MDNDDKIIIQKPEVKLFLQDDIYAFNKEKPKTYNLEEEYGKAKKNKKSYNLLIIVILVVLMGALTFAVAKYIEYENRQISVNVNVFEDLNLKKLLDVVSRLQTQMEQAVSTKNRNELARQSALDAALSTKQSELDAIDSVRLKSAEKRERTRLINSQYELTVAEINAKYDALLAESDIEIQDIQTQIDAYDSNNVERAKMQQAAIDSQRQLFDLEKQELTDRYESEIGDLRAQLIAFQENEYATRKRIMDEISAQYIEQLKVLDPVINDEEGTNILSVVEEYKPVETFSVENLPESESVIQLKEFFDEMQTAYDALEYSSDVALSVPFSNNLPSYIEAMRDIARYTGQQILNNTTLTIQNLDSEKKEALSKIESLTNEKTKLRNEVAQERADFSTLAKSYSFLEKMALENGDAGYILDVSNPQKILVYISPLYSSTINGASAFVFRKADEIVGTIKLEEEGRFIFATPVSLEEGKSFLPSDKIVLNFAN